ncbi:MAG: glycosyltransferase family 4 protein [Coprobacillus sp.]|nr:glycosyltransferase family 4 protein [Coprobacillus sp.]
MNKEGKITINVLSKADSVEGQGVGSAYLEQVALIKEMDDIFEVSINSHKKADIVHVHSINLRLWFRFRKRKGIRVMYCHFLPDTLKGSIKLPKPLFKIFCGYVMNFYKKAKYLVVVNPIFIEELVKLGVKRESIIYIPNFVSEKDFYHIKDKTLLNEYKTKYKIPLDKPIILSCGQIQTRKGVFDFIDLAKMNPDITFLWVGGFSFGVITDGYSDLKKIVENPPSNVIFTGIIPRSEMNYIYNLSDALLMTSYNELFPMTILEAASCEKPLILRDLDLYRPILGAEVLGEDMLLCKDNKEFDAAIKNLVKDPDFADDLTKKSRLIKTFYSRDHVKEMWKDFYLDIYQKGK